MTIAVACLIVWCLILSFAVYGVSRRLDVLEERSRLDFELWKGQQNLNEQYDRDITRLEDGTREMSR